MWSDSSDSELEFVGSGSKSKKTKQKTSKTKTSPRKGNKTTTPEKKSEATTVEKEKNPQLSSSSENESEEDEGAMGYGRQALGIDPTEVENYDGKSAPLNGSQYLLSVIKETKSTPRIVVADLADRSKLVSKSINYLDNFKKELDCCKSDQMNPLVPEKDWRDEKLKDFSLLRSKIERWTELITKGVTKIKTGNVKLPESGNRVVWQRFCFGIKFEEVIIARKHGENFTTDIIVNDYFKDLKGNFQMGSLIKTQGTEMDDSPLSPCSITTANHVEATTIGDNSPTSLSSEVETANDGCQPLMSILLILPQKQVEQLLYYHSDLIQKFGFLNKCQGEWLYALLSCVSKPLEPSTMADIRNICKCLINIRNDFCSKLETKCESGIDVCDDKMDKLSDDMMKDLSIESETEDSAKVSEYINALNLFIYLIGDYFGQKDLMGLTVV